METRARLEVGTRTGAGTIDWNKWQELATCKLQTTSEIKIGVGTGTGT